MLCGSLFSEFQTDMYFFKRLETILFEYSQLQETSVSLVILVLRNAVITVVFHL